MTDEDDRELLLQRTRRLTHLIEIAAPEELILKEYDLIGQLLGPRSQTEREQALQALVKDMATQLTETTRLLGDERSISENLISELNNVVSLYKAMMTRLAETKGEQQNG